MSQPRDALQSVFLEALRQGADTREAWLSERCGNDQGLLLAVQQLLIADLRSSDPLEQGVAQLLPSIDFNQNGVVLTEWQPLDHVPLVPDRYELLKSLGQGGMGSVYLAYDSQLQRKVAIKFPRTNLNAEGLSLFRREAQAAAALRHPNVCPVFDVGEWNGSHFISMAYVAGRTLDEYVAPDLPQPQRNIALIVRKVALGLEAAHQIGIIHRDIKPSNIMIDERDEPIVMDFGLACRGDFPSNSGQLRIIGTPAYMSPEQARGDLNDVSVTSDVFSLGAVFYELLCGSRPFTKPYPEVLDQIQYEEAPRLSRQRPDIDPGLDAICRRMMEKGIDERFQTMQEVADAIKESLSETKQRRGVRLLAAIGITAISMIVGALLALPKTGRLDVESLADVAILIDGIPTEGKDRRIELPVGSHEVSAYYPDGTLWIKRVDIFRWDNEQLVVPTTPEEAVPSLRGSLVDAGKRDPHLLNASGELWAVEFSPDGTLVALLLRSGMLEIRDVAKDVSVARIDTEISPVADDESTPPAMPQLLFLSQRQLMIAGPKEAIRLYSLTPTRLWKEFRGLLSAPTCVSIATDLDLLLAADQSNNVIAWRISNGQKLLHTTYDDSVAALCRIANSPFVACGFASGKVQLVHLPTLDFSRPRWSKQLPGTLNGMCMSNDGETLATALRVSPNESRTGEAVVMISSDDGSEVGRVTGHHAVVDRLTFDSSGKYLLTYTRKEPDIRIWRWRQGLEVDRVPVGRHSKISLSPGSRQIASWQSGIQQSGQSRDQKGRINLFLYNDRFIPVPGRTPVRDGPARLLVERTNRYSPDGMAGAEQGVNNFNDDVMWFPDGRRYITAHQKGGCRVWDVNSVNKPLWEFPRSAPTIVSQFNPGTRITKPVLRQPWIECSALSPDGDTIAFANAGVSTNQVTRWKIDQQDELTFLVPLTGHTGHFGSISFSPSGNQMVALGQSNDGRLGVVVTQWDLASGRVIQSPIRFPLNMPNSAERRKKQLQRATYLDEDSLVGFHSWQNDVRCWNAANGEVAWTLDLREYWPTSMALSADRKLLAVGTQGVVKNVKEDVDTNAFLIRVFRLPDRELVAELADHQGMITAMEFTPDGSRLATASSGRFDGRTWLDANGKQFFCWDVKTWQALGSDLQPKESVRSIAISPDSRFAVTAQGGMTRVWRLPTTDSQSNDTASDDTDSND